MLSKSRVDILDFNHFKSEILTPESYVEAAKEVYDAGYEADEYPPYMVIYETVHRIFKEQCSIVDNGVDLSVLSSTLGALPRLTKLELSFCEAVEDDDATLSLFASGMTTAEESYEYHIRVVSDAIQFARNMGVAIYTICLSGFNLPYCHSWEVPKRTTLSESLRKLLEFVQILRLSGSNSPLELLSHCALNVHQLDMCCGVAKQSALKDYLETHKKSLRSIGFHDVHVELDRPNLSECGLSKLSSGMLCGILKVPPSACREADCGCLPFRKEGQRILLNEDRLQRSTESSAKRKFEEV
jgi:hypothetical protein